MSSIGVSTISAPELKTVRRDDVVKFNLAYERYLCQIENVNRSKSTSQRIKPADFKSCVSPELLLSLTMMKMFDGVTEPSDVTSKHIEDWITTRSRCSTDDTPTHVNDALGRVKLKPDRSDPEGASMEFFADAITELRRNRVGHALKHCPKTLILQLISKLELPVVRESIEDAYEYWSQSQNNDFHLFMQKVSDVSIESAKHFKNRKRDTAEDGKDRPSSKRPSNDKHHPRKADGGNSYDQPKGSGNTKQRKGKTWTDKRLTPICPKLHPVKYCDITSNEEKKKFLQQYHDSKKAKKIAKLSKNRDDGRFQVTVHGTKERISLGDCG